MLAINLVFILCKNVNYIEATNSAVVLPLAADPNGDIPKHQSGERAERRNQPDGLRSARVADQHAAHDAAQYAALDADPPLVHAVCRS